MYVMMVHGRTRMRAGTSIKAVVMAGAATLKIYTTTFAMMRRVTHGVIAKDIRSSQSWYTSERQSLRERQTELKSSSFHEAFDELDLSRVIYIV